MRSIALAFALVCFIVQAGTHVHAETISVHMNDDGLHYQPWFLESFLDLKEDLEQSNSEGKRLVIFFEQKGCIYCEKIHTEVLTDPKIHDYVRDNFNVLQLNMWGDREVTDLDGEVISEKNLARKWRVLFTPTIIFLPEQAPPGQDAASAAVAVMPGAFLKVTFLSMFQFVREKKYEDGGNFQKYVQEVMAREKAAQ